MSDTEDPYAVSSDSEDEEQLRKPPPKINIEGRAVSDIKQLTAAITEKKDSAKDEARLEEIEELRKAKAAEMAKMKEEFEKGTVHNVEALSEEAKTEEKEKPSGIDKSTLSAFKSKFEKFHQNDDAEVETLDDRLKSFALDGVGKENLANMRQTFEKLQRGEISINDVREGTGADFECSEADKRRILAAFIGPKSDDDIPKNCALCEKTVYPVERLFANKKLYHSNCFRCKTCNKKLSSTQYNIHEGILYCKPHYQEVLHPELTHANVDDTPGSGEEEEDEFATVSKPKQLSSDVVRSGTNIGDELQQIRSLKEKKENLKESFKAQENIDKPKDFLDITSNVKDRMSKILAGGEKEEDSDKESDEEKQKDLDAIKAQVSDVKNKWKTGDVEKAETKDADSKNELEELRKGGIKVRERFNERLKPVADEPVSKSYDRNELDTSSAAEARKSFLDGAAFQTGPVEKTANDLQDIKFSGLNAFKDKFEKGEGDADRCERQILDLDVQLNSIKGALEKGGVDESDMTPEERAERKKKEIEAEFLRYKLARKIQAKKAAESAETEPEEPTTQDKPHLDVEVKMAGKAREKFRNIEAQNPNSVPLPKQGGTSKPSKWDTKKEPTAEIVNKRVVEESSDEEEDESAFDVKNLMNKFKNIQTDDGTKFEKANLEELEELRKQAKNLRKQFEQKNELEDGEQAEEKRQKLAEEFKHLNEEREKMQQQLKDEEEQTEKKPEEKEEVTVAADHASKMTAKWEKIHAKEAKKAGKSKVPTKST